MPTRNNATDSYVGFLFQGLYALVALLDAREGDAISVETADDVVLEGTEPALSQIKHSLGSPPGVTITNVGFWKTIRIWTEFAAAQMPADSFAPEGQKGPRLCFVTVADVASSDPLAALRDPGRPSESTDRVVEAMRNEAIRVETERNTARASGDSLPHAERAAGCAAFLALGPAGQHALVERIQILDRTFRITDIEAQVEVRLVSFIRKDVRPTIARRLIEWWDRQVALALIGRRDRRIVREELTSQLYELIADHRPQALPDDYSLRQPEPDEIAADVDGNIAKQVLLVRGGTSRVRRALEARWQARGQRGRWIEYDISLIAVLERFDLHLQRAWFERFEPMCDDCRSQNEDEKCRHGLGLLEWAHELAPFQVPPPRPEWRQPFYARGMLQQFADELVIGWHPDYRTLIANSSAGQQQTESDQNVGHSRRPRKPRKKRGAS